MAESNHNSAPLIRLALEDDIIGNDLASALHTLRLDKTDLADRFILDSEHPDFIIFSDHCMIYQEQCRRLRDYLHSSKDAIMILNSFECIVPDLNVFDYALVWNSDLKCGDRIARNIPYIYDIQSDDTFKNDLTHGQACRILESRPKFCNFMYSHSSEPRDSFFRLLSQYKKADSLGRWMNNTGIQSTRYVSDWYGLSIGLKRGYKFSIAMENAAYKGYTTEKIISSLQAHNVPIYWGDPDVSSLINPKAFINCGDYDSFDDVVERVKEIDNDDGLWLDMVTQPWQTQEQYTRTLEIADEYSRFLQNIFSQDIRKARRRPAGYWGDYCRKTFTGYAGSMPGLLTRLCRRMKLFAALRMPESLRIMTKRLFHMD